MLPSSPKSPSRLRRSAPPLLSPRRGSAAPRLFFLVPVAAPPLLASSSQSRSRLRRSSPLLLSPGRGSAAPRLFFSVPLAASPLLASFYHQVTRPPVKL